MDRGSPVALGEYIFYLLAVLIGLGWFVDFMVQLASHKGPDPVTTGLLTGVMALFVTVPRAFRRGKNGDD